jgi:hypothetical protein
MRGSLGDSARINHILDAIFETIFSVFLLKIFQLIQ